MRPSHPAPLAILTTLPDRRSLASADGNHRRPPRKTLLTSHSRKDVARGPLREPETARQSYLPPSLAARRRQEAGRSLHKLNRPPFARLGLAFFHLPKTARLSPLHPQSVLRRSRGREREGRRESVDCSSAWPARGTKRPAKSGGPNAPC